MLRRQLSSSTRRIATPLSSLSYASTTFIITSNNQNYLKHQIRSFGDFGGAGPNVGAGSSASQQTINKSNKYVNTQTSAAPFKTSCGRTFDPMTFQELLQTVTDQSWATAIQRQMMTTDREYVKMLTQEGGGAMAIDELVLKGLGGNDEEAMGNLRRLLENDYKASLSVCALQDAYVALREKRDMSKTKEAAGVSGVGGASETASLRAPFAGGNNQQQ